MSGNEAQIVARPWFDVFTFDDPPTITCPDCDQQSPALADVWAAMKWVFTHYQECAA